MIKNSSKKRMGIALLACLVVMTLSSALLITVVVQELSTRKKFEQINLETKVQNLAMSAQEIVLSFLLEEAASKIPVIMTPISGAKVGCKVQESSKGFYTIEIDAEYSAEDKKPVRSILSGAFLIKTLDGKRVAQSVNQ